MRKAIGVVVASLLCALGMLGARPPVANASLRVCIDQPVCLWQDVDYYGNELTITLPTGACGWWHKSLYNTSWNNIASSAAVGRGNMGALLDDNYPGSTLVVNLNPYQQVRSFPSYMNDAVSYVETWVSC